MAQQDTNRSNQAGRAAEWTTATDSHWTLESLYMSSSEFDRKPTSDRKPSN